MGPRNVEKEARKSVIHSIVSPRLRRFVRNLVESFVKIYNEHVCLGCRPITGPTPKEGKEAMIRNNNLSC